MKLKWKTEWTWPVIAIGAMIGTIAFKTAYDRKTGELKNEKLKNAGLRQQNENLAYHLGKNEALRNQNRIKPQ